VTACILALAAAALAAPPEEDALPLTLAEDVRRTDEVDAAYWLSSLSPPQQRRAAQPPFIDFSQLEVTPTIGMAQYSGDFEAGAGFVGAVQVRVPVPGLPGRRFGLMVEAFYATIDRSDLPFYYLETSGSAFGFGAALDLEFLYTESIYLRAQAGYVHVVWQDVVDVEDGGSLMGGFVIGTVVNRSRSATISLCYNPQLLYDSDDWVLLHQLGLQINF
jgi:hypothetical protein